MGPDGQQINAPGSEAKTSQAEGEDHQEEAGVSNQLGQPSTAAKEKRKHRLVVYSDFDDFDAKLAIERDQHPPRSSLLKAPKRRKQMKNPHGLAFIYKLMRLTFLLGVAWPKWKLVKEKIDIGGRMTFRNVEACSSEGREKHAVVADLDDILTRGRSSFHYFMLMAIEGGSILREGVVRAVLPKFYADDIHPESWRVFSSCCFNRYVVTANPRIMVEFFCKNHLGADKVLGSEIQVTKGGRATGLMLLPGVLLGDRKSLPGYFVFISLWTCLQDAFMVPPRSSTEAVHVHKLFKQVAFHDDRLVQHPAPAVAHDIELVSLWHRDLPHTYAHMREHAPTACVGHVQAAGNEVDSKGECS
ncbi:hypothetical protein L7F22_000878 [Adiantum nelumboides]|nr:hypothetical protein [Adiantum nelumboides]